MQIKAKAVADGRTKPAVKVDEDLRQHRRREILQAIAARYAPAPRRTTADDDLAPTRTRGAGKDTVPLFDMPDDMDIEPNANDEALALALQQEELGSDEDEADEDLARALALSRMEAKRAPQEVAQAPGSDSDEFEEVSLVPSAGPSRAHSFSASEPVEVLDSSDEGDDFEVVEAAKVDTAQRAKGSAHVGKLMRQSMGVSDVLEASRPKEAVELAEPPDTTTHAVRHAHRPASGNVQRPVARPTVSEQPPKSPATLSIEDVATAGAAPAETKALPPAQPAGEDTVQLTREATPSSPPQIEALSPPRRGAPSPSPPPRDAAPSPSPPPRDAAPSPSPVPLPAPEPADDSLDEDDFEEVSTAPPSGATTPALQSGMATPSDWEPTLQNSLPGPSHLRQEADNSDSEDSDAIEWSRSPSPVLRKRPLDESATDLASGATLPASGPESGAVSGHASDMASDGEMGADDMVAEEDEYARFLAQIQNRDLAAVRTEIDDEIRILNAQTKAAMRDSDEITQSMVAQIQTLLRHFGIPYITAPMEAEAQCAKLAELQLVDGIITDDSDVFLFGGTACFKNIFNDAKYAECFIAADIERELSLPRARLIELAYLLGSDYTMGLQGVGPVMALELLANFPGVNGLQKFKEWWMRVQQGTDLPVEADTKWKRSFVSPRAQALADRQKKRFAGSLHLGADWPNPLVRDAYFHPQTDESDEPFHWGFPRLAALRT